MVLKLYGFPTSTATRRVAQILHEKQVPFEFIVLDRAKSEQKDPGYLTKHPFGQVPCIDDDGFILYESRAICRYIATKWADRGTALIPTEAKARALFEQAASVEVSNFDPYAVRAALEKIIKPLRGLPSSEAAFEEAVKTLHAKLDVYEILLAKSKYLAGDEPTLADFFHLPFGTHLLAISGVDFFAARPNCDRWFKDISSRPSWLAVKDGVVSVPSY